MLVPPTNEGDAVPVPPRATASVPEEIFEALSDVSAEPLAVITLAEKLPEASRATIVEAPLASEAVVLALAIVPLDIAEAFKLVMFAPENVAELEPVPPLATGRTPLTFDSKLA
jgi:hypothetical protein